MKIKSVTIEGMHNVVHKHVDFGDIVYLQGLNGAGKSTILQAIQLGLLGYIPGTNKNKESIFQHSNGDRMEVILNLVGDQSITIHRAWFRNRSSIMSTVSVTPDGYNIDGIVDDVELPIYNFNEFVSLTPNKLKDWFLNFLPSVESKTDWQSELKQSLKDSMIILPNQSIIQDAVQDIEDMNLSGSDEIRKANEYFKSALSFKKKELERVQNTIQSLIHYDDVEDTEDSSDISRKIKDLRNRQQLEKQIESDILQNNKILAQLSAYSDLSADSYHDDVQYRQLESDRVYLSSVLSQPSAYSKFEEESRELNSELVTLRADNKMMSQVINSRSICPFTSESCESIAAKVDEYQKRTIENNNKIQSISERLSVINKERHEIEFKRSQTQNQLDEIRKKMNLIQTRYSNRDFLKDQVHDVEDTRTFEDFDSKIEALNDKLVKLESNKRYSEMIDSLSKTKYSVDQEILAYKAWINLTGVNGLQNRLGDCNPFDSFAESMNAYLKPVFGDSAEARFNLDSKANSFSFGICRDNTYTPYNLLSSGEKCMFTLSMMINLVQISKSQVKLVMVDDMFDHLDDEKFVKLFDVLKEESDTQLIFAGVKPIDRDFVIEVK